MRWALVCAMGACVAGAGCLWGYAYDDDDEGWDGPYCGNGQIEGDEQCDDGQANRDWLPDTCRADCALPTCGDEVADSDEGCDTFRREGQTCLFLGYTRGRLRCLPTCEPDTAGCSQCGDGMAQGTQPSDAEYEACDGADLRGQTCASIGHGSGTLACTASCRWDLQGCSDPAPRCGNGLWEEQEECDEGNTLDHDGCSATCEVEHPEWFQLQPLVSPTPRAEAAMAYDSRRQRVVLFGGYSVTGMVDSTALADTWELDGDTWQRVETPHSPGVRSQHAMAYDALNQRVVLFGGVVDAYGRADTWVYDGFDWQQLDTHPAYSPTPRSSHSMVYDLARQRVVLFGGYFYSYGGWDTWELDGDQWVPVELAAAPSDRWNMASTYDGRAGRVRFFGGFNHEGDNDALRELWEYDGTQWRRVDAWPAPRARFRAAMAYNMAAGVAVLFGGGDMWGPPMLHTWELRLGTWSRVDTTGRPAPRADHAMVYDSHRKRVVLFGGNPMEEGHPWPTLGDTWVYQYR